MSRQLDILAALRLMIRTALPSSDVDVIEADGDRVAPERLAPGGRVEIEYGDPGDPEIDLSPLTYNYEHAFPVTITAPHSSSGDSAAMIVADMLSDIAAAIKANRTLGGLVDHLDAYAPPIGDIFTLGASSARQAQAVLTAIYSTTDPL
ncbi:hypothetical protein PQ455_01475 [Sphingomonas naphthae]|uniref:Acyl-CoA transferase n=1 Tax=Sphingomonas naphthae TaxID=1813468 RepID=A0ABY7TME7_9SPHN|nr:hypothetical protein [Sphingomonas naphthae]WCT73931.1 hypothetical protein PQ455_01475 [Sphingomonas naphthae]